MIENMRGRSTETKYGRIPLWLYETGVGLQAIATYGWLHGRYGHYERVMPSYATLAKELSVSRGSVIAYVKALTSVGAVRIETSGAAGRQTNLYVIAFNEPFQVTGQNADHPGRNADPVVSGVYPTGQHADWGGQSVVQEGDVSTKTFEEDKDLSLPPLPTQRAGSPDVTDEREISSPINKPTTTTPPAVPAALDTPADRIITAYTTVLGRPVLARTRTALHQQAAEALTAGYPEAWLTDRARELAAHGWTDLAKHIEKSTAPLPGTAPSAVSVPHDGGLPPWCGECGRNGMPARLNVRFRVRRDGTLCHCHPDAAARSPLPGTDTTVFGWYAIRDQLRAEEWPYTGDLPRPQPTPEDRAADLGHF